MPRNLSLKSLLKCLFKKSGKKIFEEEETALSNEGTAQELRQIQVLFHTSTICLLIITLWSSLNNTKVSKLNKILAQVVQLEEDEGAVENDF